MAVRRTFYFDPNRPKPPNPRARARKLLEDLGDAGEVLRLLRNLQGRTDALEGELAQMRGQREREHGALVELVNQHRLQLEGLQVSNDAIGGQSVAVAEIVKGHVEQLQELAARLAELEQLAKPPA